MSKYTFEEVIELFESNPWVCDDVIGLFLPASEKMIRKAEAVLGFAFPKAYRDVLLRWGNVYRLPNSIVGLPRELETLGIPNGATNGDVKELLSSRLKFKDDALWHTLNLREESCLPEHYLAIYNDEGEEYGCIDVASPEGEIVAWDFFEQEVARVINKSFVDYLVEEFIGWHNNVDDEVVWPESLREKMKLDFLRIQKELKKDDDFLPDWCK